MLSVTNSPNLFLLPQPVTPPVSLPKLLDKPQIRNNLLSNLSMRDSFQLSRVNRTCYKACEKYRLTASFIDNLQDILTSDNPEEHARDVQLMFQWIKGQWNQIPLTANYLNAHFETVERDLTRGWLFNRIPLQRTIDESFTEMLKTYQNIFSKFYSIFSPLFFNPLFIGLLQISMEGARSKEDSSTRDQIWDHFDQAASKINYCREALNRAINVNNDLPALSDLGAMVGRVSTFCGGLSTIIAAGKLNLRMIGVSIAAVMSLQGILNNDIPLLASKVVEKGKLSDNLSHFEDALHHISNKCIEIESILSKLLPREDALGFDKDKQSDLNSSNKIQQLQAFRANQVKQNESLKDIVSNVLILKSEVQRLFFIPLRACGQISQIEVEAR